MNKRLLAKSYNRSKYKDSPPDYALLVQHSRDVAAACKALAHTVGHIALYNAEVHESKFKRFQLTLRANGWIQDLGKASSHFQEMVTIQPQIIQLIRHETISGILMWLNPLLRNWLSKLPFETFVISIWAAMGHHRKFHEDTRPEQCSSLTVNTSHEDFLTILKDMSLDLELSDYPCFNENIVIARDNREPCDISAREAIRDLQREFEELECNFTDPQERRLLAIIKAFGIAADVAASAVAARGKFVTDYSLNNYIDESLVKIGLTSEDISMLISKWAWERSSNPKLPEDKFSLPPNFVTRNFQVEVSQSTSCLTLAQAGCGSGKSLAAYMWAREWCQKLNIEGRINFRLFFCLPTTGTTTEHYKDYALESGIDASLTHSRSRVDLKAIAETAIQEEIPEDSSNTADAAHIALNAERDKIESLALWSTPLIVSTADTVLGLMSNARRSIYSFPVIMNSAIVFDEIHAFDEQMFGHLLVFLKHFPKIPVLLMTASLPEERRQAIKMIRPDLNVIYGPKDFEELERYLINTTATEEQIWDEVEKCLADKGKVLWVKNRVEWANDTYEMCYKRFTTIPVNVYHSRFRYQDRSHRHRRVIDNFKKEKEATILVTTQVAEMSLDLSADLLITDLAPIPSLIQRLGRLNRRSTPDNPQDPKPAIICQLKRGDSNIELPYEKIDLEGANKWLEALLYLNKPLSQQDLSKEFARLSSFSEYNIAEAEERACFFSGLWRTRPGSTRGEGYTVNILREEDLERCDEYDQYGNPSGDWIRNNEIAIPFRNEIMKWERIGAIRKAPKEAIEYDYDENTKEGTGAKWPKK